MTPTIILDFLGLIFSIKVDSNSVFCKLFKSLRMLHDKQIAIYISVPPTEDGCYVNYIKINICGL